MRLGVVGERGKVYNGGSLGEKEWKVFSMNNIICDQLYGTPLHMLCSHLL